MQNDETLFGKTFDQQVMAANGDIEGRDIQPNIRIPVEMVIESRGAQKIQVTAYDSNKKHLFTCDVLKLEVGIPSQRLQGEVIFESIGGHVRVTARDHNHNVLWGYVGSKETVGRPHCSVAMYDSLQTILGAELSKRGHLIPEVGDPIKEANDAINALTEQLKAMRKKGLEVEKVTDATRARARIIARIVSDASRSIMLEAESLRGKKQVQSAGDEVSS